jgi:hypothetical protein
LDSFACQTALVPSIRLVVRDSALEFVNVDTGRPLWRMNGRAELARRDGTVLAVEGDVIANLQGSVADNGDVLVCIPFGVAPRVERDSEAPPSSLVTDSATSRARKGVRGLPA